MSETDWLGCEDSTRMFEFLIARARSRRSPLPHRSFRLFACACCRRVWRLLADERSRAAVEESERFADGIAKRSALDRACRAAAVPPRRPGGGDGPRPAGRGGQVSVGEPEQLWPPSW
jgi:hypothetical protein